MEKLRRRLEAAIATQLTLNENGVQIVDQVDKFFDELAAKVEERRAKLKQDYTKIETREKRRLKNKQLKL